MHTNIAQCFTACQASTCSSQDSLSPHQLHSVHTVSIQCLSKTHKEPCIPCIHRAKIECSLRTQDMPTTEHVIQLITGHAGCRGLWWERQAQWGENGGPHTDISIFLITNRAVKPALITKCGGFLKYVLELNWNSVYTLGATELQAPAHHYLHDGEHSEVNSGLSSNSPPLPLQNCGWPTSKLCPIRERQGDSVSGSATLIPPLQCTTLGSGFCLLTGVSTTFGLVHVEAERGKLWIRGREKKEDGTSANSPLHTPSWTFLNLGAIAWPEAKHYTH